MLDSNVKNPWSRAQPGTNQHTGVPFRIGVGCSHTDPGETLPKDTKLSREEELLQIAIQVFSRGGFRETSLQEIADALGIARPLFYYYFESKEDLLWRIIGHLGDSLLDQARPLAGRDGTPIARLRLVLERHVATLIDNIDAFRIYFAERHLLAGKRDLRLKRGESTYHELLVDLIVEGQVAGEVKPGDPHVLARLSVGTANAMLGWYRPGGSVGHQQVLDLTTNVIVSGLSK